MTGNNQTDHSGRDNNHDITFSGNTKARSRLLIVCAVLAILFAITTVVFLTLFTYTHITFANRADPMPEKICSPSGCTTTAPVTDKLCKTPECVATAGKMISQMNLSVDPCVDFNEFACGRFNRETLIPDGESSVDTTTALTAANLLIIKGILTEEVRPGEASSLTDMKHAYISCMEEVKVEGARIAEYLSTRAAAEWPTIIKNWDGTNFEIYWFIARYLIAGIAPFYSVKISRSEKNSSEFVIWLDKPTLGLPRDYFIRPRNDTIIMAYQKYLTDFAVEMGASKKVAEQDAKDVVDLEVALAKILPTKEQTKLEETTYTQTLKELSIQYPELSQVLHNIFSMTTSTLSDNDTIENQLPTYMGNLSRVINDFSIRTLQNIFGFKYAISRLIGDSSWMIAIRNAFIKTYVGQTGNSPTWENCVNEVAATYEKEMQDEFIARAFSDDIVPGVEEMFNHIMDTFRQMIVENTWMSNATKEEVYKKVAAITLHIIGYNDQEGDGDTKVMTNQNYLLSNENNFGNQTHTNKHNLSEALIKALWDPRHIRHTKFSRWTSTHVSADSNLLKRQAHSAYGTNAEFRFGSNTMILDAGTLLPPFYSKNYPDYLNYGSLGSIIGHELTHGFDDEGSKYDEKGEQRDWWQPSDKKEYLQRMQCIINQTSSFFVEEIKMNLNGLYTQGECVADTAGLKETFRAYKDKVRKKGEETTLPGLSLTPDQLFFLSFGQAWCEKTTKEKMAFLVNTDEHPPDKYRIIGTLQNSEDFANAYNCPRGSYMNPEKKCDVW